MGTILFVLKLLIMGVDDIGTALKISSRPVQPADTTGDVAEAGGGAGREDRAIGVSCQLCLKTEPCIHVLKKMAHHRS
jgi:hypothetical protein